MEVKSGVLQLSSPLSFFHICRDLCLPLVSSLNTREASYRERSKYLTSLCRLLLSIANCMLMCVLGSKISTEKVIGEVVIHEIPRKVLCETLWEILVCTQKSQCWAPWEGVQLSTVRLRVKKGSSYVQCRLLT